jgi:hypothetical protein
VHITDISLNRVALEAPTQGAHMNTFCRRGDQVDADATIPPPIDTAEAALDVIFFAAEHPEQPQVIALLLHPDLRGRTVVVVDGTVSPDSVIGVMEMLGEAAAAAGRDQALVLASVRPGIGPLPGDVDRWLELNELADTFRCELLEWFVISDGVAWCPRDFLVEPPRWPEP